MIFRKRKFIVLFIIAVLTCMFSIPVHSWGNESLLEVTSNVVKYSNETVKPLLDCYSQKDPLSTLLKVVDIIHDPEIGLHSNQMSPSDFFIFEKLNKISPNLLQSLFLLKFSYQKKVILQRWNSKYMQENPADVFFAPSADEIIKTKAAFGCTHYARAFIAIVKALNLVNNPQDLRYVVSSKADDYNKALHTNDYGMTINGHQFVLVKIHSTWIAIDTSKGNTNIMTEGFSPGSCVPPGNIPIHFESYPDDVVFLLRKIGRNFNDDCGDDSLSALMNISRSGDPGKAGFAWEHYAPER